MATKEKAPTSERKTKDKKSKKEDKKVEQPAQAAAPEKSEVEKQRFKGYVNTHEKAPKPKRTSYENGNTRLSFNLVTKDREGNFSDINVVAQNDVADRLYAAITGDQVKSFTVIGEVNEKNNTIYPSQIQKHPIVTIEGKIDQVKETDKSTELLIGHKNEKTNQYDSFNVSVKKDFDTHGVKLEKGNNIAVNGESSVFFQQNNERSVHVQPWNIAESIEQVNDLVKERQANRQTAQEASK